MRTASVSVPMDPETAQAFAQPSDESRRKLTLLLSLRLRELTSASGRPLREVMDEVGRKAEAQGLTPQVLESLLDAR